MRAKSDIGFVVTSLDKLGDRRLIEIPDKIMASKKGSSA
jgi:hypothetical protein